MSNGTTYIDEMKEFGTFSKATQRYIRRSLDVGLGRGDPIERWARDRAEEIAIAAQIDCYRNYIPRVRDAAGEPPLATLINMAIYDLNQDRLPGFGPFRFLYERLLGASTRPWLPMVYVAASASPEMKSSLRRMLLQNISEASATATFWSRDESVFCPEWVEKVEPPTKHHKRNTK
jgi:hypothetical protein